MIEIQLLSAVELVRSVMRWGIDRTALWAAGVPTSELLLEYNEPLQHLALWRPLQRNIQVWAQRYTNAVRSSELKLELSDHAGALTCMKYSDCGTYFASSGDDDKGIAVYCCKADSYRRVWTFNVHPDPVLFITFASPTRMVSVCNSKLTAMDLETGATVLSEVVNEPIEKSSYAMSRTGRTLAACNCLFGLFVYERGSVDDIDDIDPEVAFEGIKNAASGARPRNPQ